MGRNPLFIGNAFATIGQTFDGFGNVTLSQSPIHRECFCYPCKIQGGFLFVSVSRNPLFIGNAFATNPPLRLQQSFAAGRNPLFIGNAFATVHDLDLPDAWRWMSQSPIHRECFCYWYTTRTPTCPTGSIPCRNPLFIGNAFATRNVVCINSQSPVCVSQSPIHRECFCYKMASLALRTNGRGRQRLLVAIPYSSGMLLLPGQGKLHRGRPKPCRNPLFIGNAFAT